jgi:hypothetical protein
LYLSESWRCKLFLRAGWLENNELMRQSEKTPVPIEVGYNWGHGTGVPAELSSRGDPSILARREHLAMIRVQMLDASHLVSGTEHLAC